MHSNKWIWFDWIHNCVGSSRIEFPQLLKMGNHLTFKLFRMRPHPASCLLVEIYWSFEQHLIENAEMAAPTSHWADDWRQVMSVERLARIQFNRFLVVIAFYHTITDVIVKLLYQMLLRSMHEKPKENHQRFSRGSTKWTELRAWTGPVHVTQNESTRINQIQ